AERDERSRRETDCRGRTGGRLEENRLLRPEPLSRGPRRRLAGAREDDSDRTLLRPWRHRGRRRSPTTGPVQAGRGQRQDDGQARRFDTAKGREGEARLFG